MLRVLASVLSVALISASCPATAWAQFRAARPVAPPPTGAVSTAWSGASPSFAAPSFAPAASLAAPSAFAPALAPALLAAPALSPSALPSATPAAAPSAAPSAAPAAAPALERVATALSAASTPDAPSERSRSAGDAAFDASAPRPDSESAVPAPEPSSGPGPTLSAPKSAPSARRRWVPEVPKGSRRLVAAAFAWNFLTIAAYSMVGPARGALLMTKFGPSSLPWVYMGSAALTGVVVWAYEKCAKAPRRWLVGGSLALLAVTMAGGALATAAAAAPAVSFAYFLWTDVFGIMSVTLFWTYANDVFRHDEAKSLFGLIAAAAPIGSVAGAWAVKHFVGAWGPTTILFAASCAFALVLPIFAFMERAAAGRGAAGAKAEESAPASKLGILREIASSKFLLFMAVLVGLERMVPDLTNYLYSAAAATAYAKDAAGMAAFFASVNFWTSVGSFLVSTFLTGTILKRGGVGASLMTAGLANLALFALFPFAPGLWGVAAFFALDGVARYSVFKTAKETTYSATDKGVIYRVKPYIEMFVYRLARGFAGFLLLGAAWLGGGAATVAWIGVPLALVWLYSARRVGREYEKLDAAEPPAR